MPVDAAAGGGGADVLDVGGQRVAEQFHGAGRVDVGAGHGVAKGDARGRGGPAGLGAALLEAAG